MVLRLSDCSDGLVGDDRMDWYSNYTFSKRMEGSTDEDNKQLLYTVDKLAKNTVH